MSEGKAGAAVACRILRNPAEFRQTVTVKQMFVVLFILAMAVALTFLGCQSPRAGYESAPCKVRRAQGQLELRDYPALRFGETTMTSSGNATAGVHVRQRLKLHDEV